MIKVKENIGEYFQNPGMGRDFLNMKPKAGSYLKDSFDIHKNVKLFYGIKDIYVYIKI